MKGKAETVLGAVEPGSLGRVLPHEHFEVSIESVFLKPAFHDPRKSHCDFSLNNLGWIRQFPYSNLANMSVTGEAVKEALLQEMEKFKASGGGTVVDNSTIAIDTKDRAKFALQISEKTGVHVILGTGFYVTASQSARTLSAKEEDLAGHMTSELTKGVEGAPQVKCGVIGEIGISYPITDFERRNLRASAEVERALGCPVMIHPGRDPKCPEEIVRVFGEAGGNPRRVAMAHLDRTLHTPEDISDFASLGTFLEYDLFGIETSYYQQNEAVDMPSDAQRIDRLRQLVREGYEDRILVSQDIHTRHRLESFGGHGFSHILNVVVPMMRKREIPQAIIDKFLIHNPSSWLTFTK